MVTVKIKEIDEQGRVNLTMKGLPENEELWKTEKGKDTGFNGTSAPRSRFGNGANGNNRNNGGRRDNSRGFNKR